VATGTEPAEPAESEEPGGPEEPAEPGGRSGGRRAGGGWTAAALALLAAAGFAAPLAVRAAGAGPGGATQAEIARSIDTLDARGDRPRAEIARRDGAGPSPSAPGGAASAASPDAGRRADALGVLAGTVPARGPGIIVTISDPAAVLGAEVMVDVIQELRDAGAEAIELSGVRLVASSYVVAAPGGGLTVDGTRVRAPYRLLVIGDPATLAPAMRIPGGVVDAVAAAGASAGVEVSARVDIRALRSLPRHRYAQPAG